MRHAVVMHDTCMSMYITLVENSPTLIIINCSIRVQEQHVYESFPTHMTQQSIFLYQATVTLPN